MSTPMTQIMFSRYHSPVKRTRLLEEMADSRSRAGKHHFVMLESKEVLGKINNTGANLYTDAI